MADPRDDNQPRSDSGSTLIVVFFLAASGVFAGIAAGLAWRAATYAAGIGALFGGAWALVIWLGWLLLVAFAAGWAWAFFVFWRQFGRDSRPFIRYSPVGILVLFASAAVAIGAAS